jgi:hypothetical protein
MRKGELKYIGPAAPEIRAKMGLLDFLGNTQERKGDSCLCVRQY